MSLAITDEHRNLAETARAFLASAQARAEARALLDAPAEAIPSFWPRLAELGWLGIHLDEQFGGAGLGLAELAVIVAESGYDAAPGPLLPTVTVSAVIAAVGGHAHRAALLPAFADGTAIGGIGLNATLDTADHASGDAGVVLGAALATHIMVVSGDDVVLVDTTAGGLTIDAPQNFDPTRRSARVRLTDVPGSAITVFPGAAPTALAIARTLASADAVGGATRCTDDAVAYAKIRTQFGRVIGTFGPVKHHCADMFTAAQLAAAAVWDAARAADEDRQQFGLAAAAAAALAPQAFIGNAQRCIQIHGGIGFTWEHDAHLLLHRASAVAAFVSPAAAAEDVTGLAEAGVSRHAQLDLPAEAAPIRAEIAELVDRIAAAPPAERRGLLVDTGLATPHWPRPWGRAAGPIEQLVIDEEMARANVRKVQLSITGWVVLSVISHGTPGQIDRWVRPALHGETIWCQLFSEPEAGSDAASVRTRAVRSDGGWVVNGQKIWTSDAHKAAFGLATIRTDPDAPKHAGITTMVIDLTAPGVTIVPLRDAGGTTLFNEVYFDDVFVPDSDVVGPVNEGWRVARSTLGNERVTIGGDGLTATVDPVQAWRDRTVEIDGARRRTGELIAQKQALRAMNLRRAQRAVIGGEPGPEGNVTKLLTAEHGQRTVDLAMELLGPDAAPADGPAALASMMYVYARQNTIAGGTSEISRNQIGERILGLPRDPLLR